MTNYGGGGRGDELLASHLRALEGRPPRGVDPEDEGGARAAEERRGKTFDVGRLPFHQYRAKNCRPFYVSNEIRPAIVEADGLVEVVRFQVEKGFVAYLDFVELDCVNLSMGATDRDVEFRVLADDAGVPPGERQRGLWSPRDNPKLFQFVTPFTDSQVLRILARVLSVADGGTAGVSFMPWAALCGFGYSRLEEV
jgi:hypothetical protein